MTFTITTPEKHRKNQFLEKLEATFGARFRKSAEAVDLRATFEEAYDRLVAVTTNPSQRLIVIAQKMDMQLDAWINENLPEAITSRDKLVTLIIRTYLEQDLLPYASKTRELNINQVQAILDIDVGYYFMFAYVFTGNATQKIQQRYPEFNAICGLINELHATKEEKTTALRSWHRQKLQADSPELLSVKTPTEDLPSFGG